MCDAAGRVLASIAGQPEALSWNGSVVAEAVSGTNGWYTTEVVDWRTGRVLWTSSTASPTYPSLTTVPEPGTDALAFTSNDSGTWLVSPRRASLPLAVAAEGGVF